jgi:hypothetical protein
MWNKYMFQISSLRFAYMTGLNIHLLQYKFVAQEQPRYHLKKRVPISYIILSYENHP